MKCAKRKEEIVKYETKVEGIQHLKSKKIWLEYPPERYEDSDGSQKKIETLNNGYLC